ncbi:sterol desaturase family protein [bacterium]|nr:sterol desaturase family protein [bacterium]
MKFIKSPFWLQNLTLGGLNMSIALILGPITQKQGWSLWKVLLILIAFDGLSYFWHRANHTFPFLWRWHSLHHTEPVIDTTTAFRFHPIEVLLSWPLRLALATLLSVTSTEYLIFAIIFQISNLTQHSVFFLPQKINDWFSYLLITPNIHHLHHSIHPREQCRYYGTIFSFWDRLFKSQTVA